MDNKVLVTNIQRFSLHDGPGIRTSVFCKGCSLRCPWCANPENLQPYPEPYVKDGKSGTYGRYMSCEELLEEIMKDEPFYRQTGSSEGLDALPGGVTYSGGEPLLQIDRLEPLLRTLRERGIHQCAETSLFVPADRLATALRYLDLFYVDVKILDKDRCRNILQGDIQQYLDNIESVFSGDKSVVFRVPLIGGYTDDGENIHQIIQLIGRYRPKKVELIKEHNLGKNKYLSLGKTPLDLHTVTDEFAHSVKDKIEESTGIDTEVCHV